MIGDGGLAELQAKAETLEAIHQDVQFEIPIPSPEKIICVGVNFPDRNAEYKDGQTAAAQHVTFTSAFPEASQAMATR